MILIGRNRELQHGFKNAVKKILCCPREKFLNLVYNCSGQEPRSKLKIDFMQSVYGKKIFQAIEGYFREEYFEQA